VKLRSREKGAGTQLISEKSEVKVDCEEKGKGLTQSGILAEEMETISKSNAISDWGKTMFASEVKGRGNVFRGKKKGAPRDGGGSKGEARWKAEETPEVSNHDIKRTAAEMGRN